MFKAYLGKLFLLSICCCFLLSCNDNFEEIQFSGIENVQLIELSKQGAEVEITARIKNPNNTSFTVYKSDLAFRLNGINVGEAHLSDHVKINANAEKPYSFRLKSDFSGLSLTDLPQLIAIATSKTIQVNVKGNIQAGKFFYKRMIPIDFNQKVPLDK